MPKNKINFDQIISRTKIYLVIIAIILTILCIIKPIAIIPSIIAFTLIVIYTIWTNQKRKAEISEHLNELTHNIDKAAQSTIINSPFPLVVLETNGNIIWKSSKFIKEFANIDIGNYLNDIIKELKIKLDKPEENDKSVSEKMKIGEKTYKIIGEYTKIKDREHKNNKEYMATIYFLDETKYVDLLEKYNNSKVCIDNYDELMQRATEEEKLSITAKIEKLIYNWINKYNGVGIKSERDTYICVFEQQEVDKIKEDKFEILDEIKEIKTQEKLQSTLSIAISEDGDTNLEKYKSAKAVIDIALGRGGDQAIIKQSVK